MKVRVVLSMDIAQAKHVLDTLVHYEFGRATKRRLGLVAMFESAIRNAEQSDAARGARGGER